MIFENEPIPLSIPAGVPLYRDEGGTVRVKNSRVLLDVVVGAYTVGYDAEQVAEQYTTASVGDVEKVLAFYRAHRGEVDEYLRIRLERGYRIKEQFQSQTEYREWLERFRERVWEKA